MSLNVIKTGAIAAAILLATTAASFASTWATVDHSADVHLFHSNGSPVVNTVYHHEHVKVIDVSGNWVKIQIPGQDGWVKSYVLDFGGGGGGYGGGGTVCFWGPLGKVCIHP